MKKRKRRTREQMIVARFKEGVPIEALMTVYGLFRYQVEAVIRREMIRQQKESSK